MVFKQGLDTAGRAARLVRIGRSARAVARSGEANRESAKRALAGLLADARGVPMKIGQFLAGMPGNEAFEELVTGIAPSPLDVMLPALDEQLKRPHEEVFSRVEDSHAAASLGQVHRAELREGGPVAVKLQYPDIASAVDAELRLAGLLPGLGPAKKWGFDVGAYKTALREDLDRELDYRSEAARQERFRNEVMVPGLVVPEAHEALCNRGLLVQSWETGASLTAAAAWPVPDRRRVAEILMETFFKSLFVSGLVHCDPNEGNYFIRRPADGGPEVVLLDFGCTLEIPERARLALLKTILGCGDNDETDPLACFVEMGFDGEKLAHIAEVLPALCKVLFEPFLQDDPYSTKYWELRERVDGLLGELRWWFRSAGPASQFMLMRAFSGLTNHLDTLKIIVPWRTILFRAVGEQGLEKARRFAPSPVDTGTVRKAARFDSIAKLLKVRVTENGKQVVQVSMPAARVSVLEELIPEDVLVKVRAENIDVKAIAQRACEAGIIPQELFALKSGNRNYRVWLE